MHSEFNFILFMPYLKGCIEMKYHMIYTDNCLTYC